MEIENLYKRDSEKQLIKAVSTIVEEDGFTKVGINRIARTAGCDKVLIYRYFGGLEGLLAAWAKENDYYTFAYDRFMNVLSSEGESQTCLDYDESRKTTNETGKIKIADQSQLRELTRKVIVSQLHFLRENKVMQELILWELSGHSKFKTLQDIREKNGNKLQQLFNDMVKVKTEDAGLYVSVLITSIEFMVLYTRQYRFFNGVDFSEPSAWVRFEKVISNYVDMLFDALT
ncbi:MAG: TetR/AcrR family transcriptional regulator [Tannerella sp.]|nr:TetR/AcrR family transcriptional regulator [Tannerella sp.]